MYNVVACTAHLCYNRKMRVCRKRKVVSETYLPFPTVYLPLDTTCSRLFQSSHHYYFLTCACKNNTSGVRQSQKKRMSFKVENSSQTRERHQLISRKKFREREHTATSLTTSSPAKTER